MANQHTKAAEAAQSTPATNDGPDLDPTPTAADEAMQAQMDEMQAELEAAHAALAAARRPAPAVVVNNAPAVSTAVAPTESTYEPGDVDEEGVAYAATIICTGPKGDEVECTPKVFRQIMAAKGYVAHPTDANMHLSNEPRRTRRNSRGANAEGTAPEQAPAARRRRRAPAAS